MVTTHDIRWMSDALVMRFAYALIYVHQVFDVQMQGARLVVRAAIRVQESRRRSR